MFVACFWMLKLDLTLLGTNISPVLNDTFESMLFLFPQLGYVIFTIVCITNRQLDFWMLNLIINQKCVNKPSTSCKWKKPNHQSKPGSLRRHIKMWCARWLPFLRSLEKLVHCRSWRLESVGFRSFFLVIAPKKGWFRKWRVITVFMQEPCRVW